MYSRLGEGEGFKVGIIPYRDIPLMFLHDVEVKPGSATSIVVHPQITRTSEAARERWQLTAQRALRDKFDVSCCRFKPEDRGCYFQDEFETDPDTGLGGRNRNQ